MLLRRLACATLVCLLATAIWAKDKVTIKSLIAKSDAVYYTPAAHGLNDLAVDFVVKELADDPVGKNAAITYYYAGGSRRRLNVANIPDAQARYQQLLMDLLSPLGQYVVPVSSTETFSGMTLKINTVNRLLLGVPGTTFYEIVASVPGNLSPFTKYAVLLDKDGFLHQIEYTLTDNTVTTASMENINVKDGAWLFSVVNTHIALKDADMWMIFHFKYDTIEGFILPTQCTVQFRNAMNKPIEARPDYTVDFKNYRLNKGIAAAAITESEKKSTATTTPAP